MKPENQYEERRAANRMESIMIMSTVAALVAAIFAFLYQGWIPGVGLLLLGSLAFGLSRLFAMIEHLMGALHQLGGQSKPIPRSTEVSV